MPDKCKCDYCESDDEDVVKEPDEEPNQDDLLE